MRYLLKLLVVFAMAVPARAAEPEPLASPFVGGQDGYAVYRIPALVVTQDGQLLAVAEARRTPSDQAQNKLVARRSADGGHTWGALTTVVDDGANSLNNPTAVVLRDSGHVLLVYQRYSAHRREGNVKPGVTGDETCLCYVTHSDDNGRSWSTPADITPQVKRSTVATSIASGPGIGIELRAGPHAGRIVMPFNQGPPGHWQVYAAYSDDHGDTWKFGDLAPTGADGRGNEIQMAELSGGRVMLNTRPSSGKRLRKVATSDDGGATWSPLRDDVALPDSQCQGSLLRDGEALLFVNPAVPKGRTHGTVRLSVDDGATWSASRLLVEGEFAYSALAAASPGEYVCLYETDDYRRIAAVRFNRVWLSTSPATRP